MKIYGYVRVSTTEQKLDVQIEEIEKYCKYRGHEILRIFQDKSTGKNEDRNGFIELTKILRKNPEQAEGIIVYKLDRVGRSLKNLINFIEFLESENIQFLSISDNIDTSSPAGKLFFQMTGAFAEYEVALINERISIGKQHAKEKGVKFGRPNVKVNMSDVDRLIAAGVPKTLIAKQKGIALKTLYNRINESKLAKIN